MRRKFAILSVIVATLAALSVGGIGVLTASGQAEKVDICHRTNSATNPYVAISVDVSAVDGISGNSGNEADHFGEHKGPLASSEAVAQNLKDNGIEWGDIIPPIPGAHGGLNWPGGQSILENNCNFVTPPTTTPPTTAPPTTQPPVTPTTQPPVTPTTQPPGAAAAPPGAARPGAAAAPSAPRAPTAGAVAGAPRTAG